MRFKITDPPRVPSEPSGPNRPLLTSLVLVAGLGAGLAVAFLIAQLWPTFDSRRSLMRVTQIPVFGSVSAILSPAARRRERWHLIGYFALGSCLLLVYVGLLAIEIIGFTLPF